MGVRNNWYADSESAWTFGFWGVAPPGRPSVRSRVVLRMYKGTGKHSASINHVPAIQSWPNFLNSPFAMVSIWTSSGPSANRSVRALAQAAARKVSWETPAPP